MHNPTPNRCCILGSGYSVRDNLWNISIDKLPVWEKIQNEFTIGTNFTYNWFTSTVLLYSDYQFYFSQKHNLKNVPLILGKKDGAYLRKGAIKIDNNVVLLKECERKQKLIWKEREIGLHAHYWGKDAWTKGWYCYDKETEILTEQGWKFFKDLNKKEKILTLNSKTDKIEYHYPTNYIKYKYKGNMIREKNKKIDLLVTPNHRMYIKKGHHRNLKNYFFERADNLEKYKEIIYRVGIPYEGTFKKYFMLPEVNVNTKYYKPAKKINMNYWLQFLGWYLSEGSYYYAKKGNYRVYISQSDKKPKYCKEIEKIIKKCGFKYYKAKCKTCNNYVIHNKQLFTFLKQFGHSHDKYISREFLNLKQNQLKLLLQTLVKGDGSINKNTGQISYFTASDRLANDVSELSLKCDYVPYSYKRRSGFNNSLGHVLNINKTQTLLVQNNIRERVPYDDDVYCVEVPNHVIYVRRNGHSCWSGNCSQLIGLKALNMAIALDCKEIYLLGFDAGGDDENRTHFYSDTEKGSYVWNGTKHCGVGKDKKGYYKTGNYNKLEELNKYWFEPFEDELKKGIRIYNVSLNSNITTIPKISYNDFYNNLNEIHSSNQNEIREYIKFRLRDKNDV